MPVALQRGCCSGACHGGAGSPCGRQPHARKLPQAAAQGHELLCFSARLLILSVWYLTSVRGQETDLFNHHCDQVCSCHYQGHVMGLTPSWMEIRLRTEHSKLSEPAQLTHCPGHLGSHFSPMISSLLWGWMNYMRFLGPQTSEMGL